MRFILSVFVGLFLGLSVFSQERTTVLISTSFGDMMVELYNETPQHRDNFIKLVEERFYDGTLFHRVIPNFMIQGGDPDSKGAAPNVQLGNGGPGYTIPAEFVDGLFHKKGALAAARLGDAVNPKKESSGSQFYLVQGQDFTEEKLWSFGLRSGKKYTQEQTKTYRTIGGTPHLDGAYTVFGEVVKGLEVIELIANQKRDKNNRPLKDVEISISIIK
ncbi:MAG: peptidylprolyl isomerase [Flavobacteriales bacterium]|nr:peptidylprolyl isomerase [Flavobacteriales bacterium]|tara:strand:+ start:509 stop:1159 length:651 start_codon:yes stop_codon:yes gene_type:complete